MAVAKARARLRLVGDSAPPGDGGAASARVAELYGAYRGALGSYVARMLPGGRQEAEVVLQETYMRLLRMDSLQPLEESPRAYIFTVATNLVRDQLRRHLRRRADLHEQFDERDHASAEPSPQGSAEWQQSLQRLKKSLLGLKPLTRRIFLLSRFEEMSYPEIAAALSISSRSVERHMSRALKHLQGELEDIL